MNGEVEFGVNNLAYTGTKITDLAPTPTPEPTPTPTPTPTPSPVPVPDDPNADHNHAENGLGLLLIIGVIAAAFIVISILCLVTICCYQKMNSNRQAAGIAYAQIDDANVGNPNRGLV